MATCFVVCAGATGAAVGARRESVALRTGCVKGSFGARSARPWDYEGELRAKRAHRSGARILAVATPSSNKQAVPAAYGYTHDRQRKQYDYVIVGGGAAGCVLANRLSEDRNVSVLLVESGGKGDSLRVSIPLGFPYLPGSDIDYKYESEPESALFNRRIFFPRGHMLGGSHAMSVMLYHRGSAADYDGWVTEYGATGWSSEDVLPYFRKSAHQTRKIEHDRSSSGDGKDERQKRAQKKPTASSKFHAKGGPLTVSDLKCVNPLSNAFLEAAEQTGLPLNPDFNDWELDQSGIGTFQVTQRDGMRESPRTAYLQPVQGTRRNLTVMTGCTVERVMLDTDANGSAVEARGVMLLDRDQRKVVVEARREVILAAGSIATPQLLMLSGIGPRKDLEAVGIPVAIDSPGVGCNLQDQPAAMLSIESKQPYVDKRRSDLYYTEATGKSIRTLLRYLFLGSGPLTSPMCEAGGFVRSGASKAGESCDLQLRFIPFVSEPDPYFSLGDFATGGAYLENKSNRPAGYTLQTVLARPKARGRVTLKSADVRDRPIIHANWLDNKQDMKAMVEGLKLCRKIASRAPLTAHAGAELYPGPEIQSDADIETYIRESCHTANAIVGTCRMGADDDEMAPLDAQLKVKGVRGLRVVDSSVMPTLPGGQAGAPTMMIAEKAADLIRAEHQAAIASR
eukprot:CAMPEP_0185829888 /NCGR_PEP_ID=MMETSP1353-20130828/510_1 /TAXON_ID=1077150 /ORGANISM="Erythrolobus australicus, Strain CCMP3124" /LENGTH=680 /DNA_ID=CAMNT_0028527729 /DNA_START=64 /DNA_END=2106 /DNA_ORIENTATION=+